MFLTLLRREIRLGLHHRYELVTSLIFFLLCVSLFPLALGPSQQTLLRVGPAIIWVCALLAAILPLGRLFYNDWADGSLDYLLLSGHAPSSIVYAKMITHWIMTGLPLIAASFPLALFLGIQPDQLTPLLLGLCLGTPTFSLVGSMAAAVALGARNGSLLLPLLAFPLLTPVLIFGAATSYQNEMTLSVSAGMSLLGAFFLTAIPICGIAAGSGLQAATQ